MSQFQEDVANWLVRCFGERIARDKAERNHRFIEEALELVQSTGCSIEEVIRAVDYVYARPVGEPRQEVGGVMVTLAALCSAHVMDMEACGFGEIRRCELKSEEIREKQKLKPKFLPVKEQK